jgi:regulatory protein
MLARRELSEAQVRQRLALKGHAQSEIDEAIERLKNERAIDDERVAEAIAHTAITVHRRGKLRVRRQIEQAGIARALASRVTDAVFAETDPDALLNAALAKRLRHGQRIVDRAHLQRLYRYLIGQGFDSDRVLALLNRHSRSAQRDE